MLWSRIRGFFRPEPGPFEQAPASTIDRMKNKVRVGFSEIPDSYQNFFNKNANEKILFLYIVKNAILKCILNTWQEPKLALGNRLAAHSRQNKDKFNNCPQAQA